MHKRNLVILATMLMSGAMARATAGPTGHYQRLNESTYLLVLSPGAKVIASLKAFQRATGVRSASITGVGLTRNTVLGFYQFAPDGTPSKKHAENTVTDPREVVSLTCNLTTHLGATAETPPPHCHIALAGKSGPLPPSGAGFPVVGGHLIEADVAVTMELFVSTFPEAITKSPSVEFGGVLVDTSDSSTSIPLPN